MITEWEEFLDPYIQAVGELKIKLRGIRKQYRKQNKHSPIEFVTGRVKPIESIKERLEITAKIAHQLDEEMGKIRDDIQEAQALFDPLSRKLNDGVGNSDDTDEEYR